MTRPIRSSLLLRSAPLWALALAPTLAGCFVYDAKLLERDSGSATGSRQPPTRPEGTDDGEDVGEVSFALRNVFLDQGDMWRTTGYDLDRRYTQAPLYDTECTPPSGTNPAGDGDEGIDNVFGQALYPLVAVTVPGLQETARAAQDEGFGLPVIRITGWNGQSDDVRVEAVITTAVYGTSADGADGEPPNVVATDPRTPLIDGETAPLPAWDQEDWFWVRQDSYVANDASRPRLIDDNAYVSGGRFVIDLPEGLQLLFSTADVGVLVQLTEAVAVATLGSDGNLSDVTVAGRWSLSDLLSTAENVGICVGTPQYNILLGQLERIADVRRQSPEPGDPILECDALSVGVTFTGTRIHVAGLAPGVDVENACASSMDGGVSLDGGVGIDGGVEIDASVPPDAFVPRDAAAAPDAFAAADASTHDAAD